MSPVLIVLQKTKSFLKTSSVKTQVNLKKFGRAKKPAFFLNLKIFEN